ncbi:hypothetical protein PLESTF_001933500 [Pleodorina starrii]|nr:hypothetical protein PLESTF_001933500 [Pleodorina starrii]
MATHLADGKLPSSLQINFYPRHRVDSGFCNNPVQVEVHFLGAQALTLQDFKPDRSVPDATYLYHKRFVTDDADTDVTKVFVTHSVEDVVSLGNSLIGLLGQFDNELGLVDEARRMSSSSKAGAVGRISYVKEEGALVWDISYHFGPFRAGPVEPPVSQASHKDGDRRVMHSEADK